MNKKYKSFTAIKLIDAIINNARESRNKFKQRFTYLHNNPVRAGFVKEPQDWSYSSGIDCYANGRGLLDLTRVD